jgi:hypothetical protein
MEATPQRKEAPERILRSLFGVSKHGVVFATYPPFLRAWRAAAYANTPSAMMAVPSAPTEGLDSSG